MMNLQALKVPRLMGVVNITADSFSDGGLYLNPEQAVARIDQLVREGAQLIDLGAESTRPGSKPVPEEVELHRLLPLLKIARKAHPELIISVDTRKSAVAEQAIEYGADIINDVSALRHDPRMAGVLAANPSVVLILMHMQGEPETMQQNPHYGNVLDEVDDFFRERIDFAVSNGIALPRLMLDPGIGFGKDLGHNLALLANLDRFDHFGIPLVVGASRKRFIAAIDNCDPDQRLGGSLAAAVVSVLKGAAIIRVHDVRAHLQMFNVLQRLMLAEAKWDS
jgi:dihydropteroate synthase